MCTSQTEHDERDRGFPPSPVYCQPKPGQAISSTEVRRCHADKTTNLVGDGWIWKSSTLRMEGESERGRRRQRWDGRGTERRGLVGSLLWSDELANQPVARDRALLLSHGNQPGRSKRSLGRISLLVRYSERDGRGAHARRPYLSRWSYSDKSREQAPSHSREGDRC
jgi:hypothetical protein